MVTMTQRHYSIPRANKEIIGSIIFYWATIEFVLVDIIGAAMAIDLKARRIFLAKMDAKAKIAMLKVVKAKYIKSQKIRTMLTELAKVCHGLYELRNMMAHGVWVHPVDNPDQYDLLIIDSGSTAYLPKRMTFSKLTSIETVNAFEKSLQCAVHILRSIVEEKGIKQYEDGDGSVSSVAESPTPIEVPKDVGNASN